MDTISAVLDRIRQLCTERDLAYNALAHLSGVHPSTVKGIVSGKSKNPGIITLKKLCDGLEIPLPEFFNTDEFFNLEQEIR